MIHGEEELLEVINDYHLTKDDLICAAELLEDEGQYMYIRLIGYSARELRDAAFLLGFEEAVNNG